MIGKLSWKLESCLVFFFVSLSERAVQRRWWADKRADGEESRRGVS